MSVEVRGLEKLRQIVRHAPDNIREGLDQTIAEVAEAIKGTIAILIHSRTGHLASSFYVFHVGPVQYDVRTDVPYGLFVDRGTAPHMIYPRNPGGVLRFEVGGDVVFTRYVHHPGTWPQNFMEAALEYHKQDLLDKIRDGLTRWIHWSDVRGQ